MSDENEATSAPRLSIKELSALGSAVLDEVGRAVVGKREAAELVLIGLLAGGNVLIEDLPGLAKTLLVRSFAQVLDLSFSRVQFTPDLLPADLTGSAILDPRRGELSFHPGPLFANLVLGDEINRAPPKTQAALLEAMQEHQITVDGVSHHLPAPFSVIATENPIEYEGTYPLPEAQLDRFLLRVGLGYPDRDTEWEVLERRIERRREQHSLSRVGDASTVLAMQACIEDVEVSEAIGRYIVDLVRSTRERPEVQVGASPRGGLALLQTTRARAALDGRDFVLPDDVKALATPALAHRISLRPELWIRGGHARDVVRACIESLPVPVQPEPANASALVGGPPPS
jgi:MoxR-like ATPase